MIPAGPLIRIVRRSSALLFLLVFLMTGVVDLSSVALRLHRLEHARTPHQHGGDAAAAAPDDHHDDDADDHHHAAAHDHGHGGLNASHHEVLARACDAGDLCTCGPGGCQEGEDCACCGHSNAVRPGVGLFMQAIPCRAAGSEIPGATIPLTLNVKFLTASPEEAVVDASGESGLLHSVYTARLIERGGLPETPPPERV